MPSFFTSFWGSSIHGVEIKWTNDITTDPVTLTAEYTSNYYWNPLFYYDSNLAADNALLAILGTEHAIDMKPTIDTLGGAPYAATVETTALPRPIFNFQFFIQKPTASTVYDGFNGKAFVTGKTGSGETTGTVVTPPEIIVQWLDKLDGISTGTSHVKDLFPSADFDVSADTVDNWTYLATDMKWDDSTTTGVLGVGGTNLCAETWLLSNTAIACVKMTGTASRDWTVSATSASNAVADTTQDWDFDYVDHQISTQFGKEGTAFTGTKIQFAAKTVSFAQF